MELYESFNVVVPVFNALQITTTNPLLAAVLNSPYSLQFTATNGVPSYSWTLQQVQSGIFAGVMGAVLNAQRIGYRVGLRAPCALRRLNGNSVSSLYQSTSTQNVVLTIPSASSLTQNYFGHLTLTGPNGGMLPSSGATFTYSGGVNQWQWNGPAPYGVALQANNSYGAVYTAPTTPTINWNPGDYLLTYNQPWTYNTTASYISSDITEASSKGFKGYAAYMVWSFIEGGAGGSGTQGDYSNVANNGTSPFAQIMSALQADNLKLIVQFNPGVFNTGNTHYYPVDSGAIPSYITTNATYGPAQVGTSGCPNDGVHIYGWYEQQDGGYGANWQNSNVQTKMLAAVQNFATLWDGQIEAFVFCADDVMYPFTGTGLTGSGYFTALQTILLAIKSYFTKSNVALQMAGSQTTQAQQMAQTLVQAGVLVSWSDTGGATFWNNTYHNFNFASIPSGTSGTLTSALPYPGNIYQVKITSTGQQVTMTTDSGGTTAVTFSPAVTGATTTAASRNQFPPLLPPMQQAWVGVQSPFSSWTVINLQTYSTSIAFVEAGDVYTGAGISPIFPTTPTPTDICNACNDVVPGGYKGLHSSHRLWTYDSAFPATWSAILAAIAANPVTNTAYPPVYG